MELVEDMFKELVKVFFEKDEEKKVRCTEFDTECTLVTILFWCRNLLYSFTGERDF